MKIFKKIQYIIIGVCGYSISFAMFPFQSPYLEQSNIDIVKQAITNKKYEFNLTMDDDQIWTARIINTVTGKNNIENILSKLPLYYGNAGYFFNVIKQKGMLKYNRLVTQYNGYFIESKSTKYKKATYYITPTEIQKVTDGYVLVLNKVIILEVTKPTKKTK